MSQQKNPSAKFFYTLFNSLFRRVGFRERTQSSSSSSVQRESPAAIGDFSSFVNPSRPHTHIYFFFWREESFLVTNPHSAAQATPPSLAAARKGVNFVTATYAKEIVVVIEREKGKKERKGGEAPLPRGDSVACSIASSVPCWPSSSQHLVLYTSQTESVLLHS